MDRELKSKYTIAVVTSSLYDYGSEFIKTFSSNPEYNIICIYNKKTKARSKKKVILKIFKIGITGALIGLYLRKFYKEPYLNIEECCIKNNIPFYTIQNFNPSDFQKKIFRDINLGISMGNGYIPSSFYSLFREGMINIHHEILPEYPGASSIIWQLYNSSKSTGFTIHRVDKKIDAGKIIYKEHIPINFKPTLGETISENYKLLKLRSIIRLHETIIKLKNNDCTEENNYNNKSYTTPTLFQYFKILKNYKKLRLDE